MDDVTMEDILSPISIVWLYPLSPRTDREKRKTLAAESFEDRNLCGWSVSLRMRLERAVWLRFGMHFFAALARRRPWFGRVTDSECQ